jgi:hypothetical protein
MTVLLVDILKEQQTIFNFNILILKVALVVLLSYTLVGILSI